MRAGELRAKRRAAQPVDRLAIQLLGGSPSLTSARERASTPSAQSVPAGCVVSASRSSASRASASSPVRAAASTSSGSAQIGDAQARWRLDARLRRSDAPPRSGRDRCRGRRPPSARTATPGPRRSRSAFSIAALIRASTPRLRARGRPRAASRRKAPMRTPVAAVTASASATSDAASAEVAAPGDDDARPWSAVAQRSERAGVAGELELPGDDGRRSRRMSQTRRRASRPSHPTESTSLVVAKRAHGSPQRRRRGGQAVRHEPRQPVEQQVGRTTGRAPGRGAPGRRCETSRSVPAAASPPAASALPQPRGRSRARARRRAARAASPP